jgi:hypothetical protein
VVVMVVSASSLVSPDVDEPLGASIAPRLLAGAGAPAAAD